MTDIEKLREQNDAFRRTLIETLVGGVVEWDTTLKSFSKHIKRAWLRRIKNFKQW